MRENRKRGLLIALICKFCGYCTGTEIGLSSALPLLSGVENRTNINDIHETIRDN